MQSKKVPVWAVLVIVLSIIVAVTGLSFIGPYNKMVSLQETVETRQSDIQSQLQEKMDKISQMLPLVESYVEKNSSLQEELNNLQSYLSLPSAASVSELEKADESSTKFLQDLSLAYATDSSASASVLSDYMVSVEGMENRLSIARMKYNEAVQAYNTYIKKFPHNIVAGLFGFEAMPAFQTQSES